MVVGVGASAGGLEAFRSLLGIIPNDLGMAFVLVQHLDPRHKSLLAELLAPKTSLRVVEATHEAVIEADTVYVIPSNTKMSVRDGCTILEPASPRVGVRLSVDYLFISLAREYGARAVGIVLSGAGHDGTIGLRHIRGCGGLTIVQEPGSAGQPGMPRSAIDAGVAELVLPLDEIPAALERFERLPPTIRAKRPTAEDDVDDLPPLSLTPEVMDVLTEMLRNQRGFDPQIYRLTTLERRIRRRMMLSGFEGIDAYLAALDQDPDQQDALVRDMLISVTDFFRDPEAFRALRTMVVEPHVAAASSGETIRVWVPGCATGEEAYSIAMEFLDASAKSDREVLVQVFATDIDRDALDIARAGVFPASITEHVSPDRLERYFEPVEGRGFRILPEVRDVVSFAEHDICVDPPFSRIHLVSFRNVLIYMRPEAQTQVLEMLHFALNPDGNLMLGMAESVGSRQPLFSTISKKWRLYRKVGVSRVVVPDGSWARRDRIAQRLEDDSRPSRTTGNELARQLLADRYLPPSLVVSGSGTVLYMNGELRPYLHFPDGNPTAHLGSIVAPELATRAQATVYRCRRDNTMIEALTETQKHGRARLVAHPAPEIGEGAVTLAFYPVPEETAVPDELRDADAKIIAQLDMELQATREDLRNTVEELETSNEELRSSNEESMSMNEELQSTNEELKATNEELRSLTEELCTVNAQLQEKVKQITRARDDLTNFFRSTKIPTLFLDEELRIKRFTPAAEQLLRIDQDVEGQRVEDVARQLLQEGLADQARQVLDSLAVLHSEIRTDEGQWISRTVLPYRTRNRRIEGVVVTLVDISELKQTTDALAVREQQRAVVARLGLISMETTSVSEFLDQAALEVQQTLRTDYCEIFELEPGGQGLLMRAGAGWPDGLVGQATVGTSVDSRAGFTLNAQNPVVVEDLEAEHRFRGPPLLREHDVVSGISCTIRDSSGPYGVLGAHCRSRRQFSLEDSNFVLSVAAVIAAAVSRQQVQMQLTLENACSRALLDSADLVGAVKLIYQAVAGEVGASIGELWQVDDATPETLHRIALFADSPFSSEQVENVLGSATQPVATSAEGQASAACNARWFQTSGDGFTRANQARALGLRTVLVLPIIAAQDVLGVLCLFTRERLYVSQALLRSLDSVGQALGESVRRKSIEHALRRMATIAEAAQDAVMSLDLDGTITGWLPGALRLYGFTEARVLGASVELIVPEDRRAELWQQIERLRQGEQLEPFESVRQQADGTLLDVSVRLSPILDEAGRVIGLTESDRDITERRRASAALAQSEARFRSAFENAAVGIAHIDLGPRLVFRRVNDRLLKILGYSREEMLQKSLEEVTHPDHVDADLEDVQRLTSREIEQFTTQKRFIRKDGASLWVQVTASLVSAEAYEPDYAIIVVEDISSRKEADERRAQSEWRFRRVLEGSPVPMLVCDGAGQIIERSRSWTTMFGFGPDEVSRMDQWAERVYGKHAPEVLAYLDRQWEGDESETSPEADAITKDGRRLTLMLSGAPLGRQEGRALCLCAAADVTRQKNAERELLEASRQKDEFLAMLGHELRNPLAVVHGAVRLPELEHIDDPSWRHAQSILERHTARMSKLLNGLLDVSRIVSGQISLELQDVDLRQVVSEVAGDHLAQCQAKGLSLDLSLPPESLYVQGDPVRLAQVVDNLLSNAIKYSDTGSIDVALRLDEPHAILSVRDTGIGMEPELIPHIFDSFRQAEQNLHRTRGGLGLGLALVHSLVQMHGGRVEARSEGLERGSEFVVWLPRASAPVTGATSEPSATRILVIEDEADLADVLRRILERDGHEVRVAGQGREGIDIAVEWQPAVVLCDIGLPGGVSGYEVAQELRATAETQSIALVAVTGYGRPKDKARAFEVGFDAHITKPIELNALEQILAKVLARK